MNGRRNCLAASAATLLLAGISATPAMASNVLEIGTKANLVARGAAVDVPVTYTCSPPAEGAMFTYWAFTVRVTQVVRGQQVVAATTDLEPVCDDTFKTTTARVTLEGATSPFKSGIALVDANLYTSDDISGPVSAKVSQEVRIVP